MYVKRPQHNSSVLLTRPRSALFVMKSETVHYGYHMLNLEFVSWEDGRCLHPNQSYQRSILILSCLKGPYEIPVSSFVRMFACSMVTCTVVYMVHGCNKLATRHVRLQLSEARAVPQCDICENAPAFFFCGIDGTSLCLQCDMDVHVGGKRTHERYLLLGQRVEPISKKPSIEQGVELQPFYATKDGRRLENQLPHQSLQEKRDNSTSSANAIVVGDVDVERVSMMIDLNSQPHCMQGQTSNGIQCVRDMEIRSTSDDECTGAVPHMSLKK